MFPVVIFPDATQVVIDYLAAELDDRDDTADVRSKVPEPRPERFVTVLRAGGPRRTVVSDAALMVIEAWADTAEDAHDLVQLCRALIFAMSGTSQSGVAVYRVTEAAGPQDLPDPLSEKSRFTFTVEVQLRGASETEGETS